MPAYHNHFTEEFGYIDAKGHAGNDLLYCLQILLRIPLDLRVTKEGPVCVCAYI